MAKTAEPTKDYVLVTIANQANGDARVHVYGPHTSAEAQKQRTRILKEARDRDYYNQIVVYVRKLIDLDRMNERKQ